MRGHLLVLLVALASQPALPSGPAHAIPPPLPVGDLRKLAELIIDVESLQALCEGGPVAHLDRTVQRYRYQLKILRAQKGVPPKVVWQNGTVVQWKPDHPRPPILPDPVYPVGWRGTLYMARTQGDHFELVHRSGVVPHPDNGPDRPLPDCRSKGR